MSVAPAVNKLAIIGVGLIGGSLALALKRAGYVREVVGAGRSARNLQEASSRGVIDRIAASAAEAARGADMVVVAAPIGAMRAVFSQIAPSLSEQAVVTDVGSVKGAVVADARAALGARFPAFVPGHPIAGTERSGAAAAFPELFERRRVVLAPVAETQLRALEQVQALWQAAGAEVMSMTVAEHDDIFALTSHLPHLLAYAMVDTLLALDDERDLLDFAAGGFRDFTRIASSDPTMWRDICLGNRAAILRALAGYRERLEALSAAVAAGDDKLLLDIFTRAKTARDKRYDHE